MLSLRMYVLNYLIQAYNFYVGIFLSVVSVNEFMQVMKLIYKGVIIIAI